MAAIQNETVPYTFSLITIVHTVIITVIMTATPIDMQCQYSSQQLENVSVLSSI